MSEQGNKARKALHDMRWGPHIKDVIERQEAMDDAIKAALQAISTLEAKLERMDALERFVKAHDTIERYTLSFGSDEQLAIYNLAVKDLRDSRQKIGVLSQDDLTSLPTQQKPTEEAMEEA